MQFTIAAAASILAFTASAAPLAPRDQGTFSLIASHSGNTQVHLRSINANGESLWIGKDTASYCPEGSDCPAGTVTAFGAGSGALSMDVVVPGGQQAYVAPDGKFGYTIAHSASVPEGAVRTGFTYTAPTQEGGVGTLTLDGSDGFLACPVAQDDGTTAYQIVAAIPGASISDDCIGVGLAASPFDGAAAWEYT